MRKAISRLILPTLLLLVFSCGGGGGGSSGSSGGDNINVTGRWEGTFSSSRGSGSFSMTLEQNGNSFTGSGSVSGSDCFFSISVSGSISGGEINFGFAEDFSGDRVNFDGSVSSSSMSGTWSVPSGFCSGDRGTFSATK